MRDKRVLVARNKDDEKVIVKISDSPNGKREISSEKEIQDALTKAVFSQENIFFPNEVFYGESNGFLIRITNFIDQEKVFGAHTIEEQFFMIMREFETQESFYANTFEHINMIKNVFSVTNSKDYVTRFSNFDVGPSKSNALELLKTNKDLMETRSNYLTHTDFVPSNFRVVRNKIFMIDLSSMHFANKYEGLARFLNWCIIHNPQLETLICEYIKNSRGEEEYLCLRLMRIYKAGFLINHYNVTLSKTTGDLYTLTKRRLELWQKIIKCLIEDSSIPLDLIDDYKKDRNELRSAGELKRQKEFNIL